MDETRSAAMTGAAMKQFQERRAAARHAAIVVAGTDSPQVL